MATKSTKIAKKRIGVFVLLVLFVAKENDGVRRPRPTEATEEDAHGWDARYSLPDTRYCFAA